MAPTITINEQTTLLVTVYFWDEDGAAATPASATYRLQEGQTGRTVVPPTALAGLSTSKEIEITPTQNAFLTTRALMEERILTVEWSYGSGRHGTEEYRYYLKNLAGVN